MRPGPKRHRWTSHVTFEIEIGFIQRLPDSIEGRPAVGPARRAIRLCGQRHGREGDEGY
jgi:hypothetical protein